MDDKTKEFAMKFMKSAAQKIPVSNKFPIRLCDSKEQTSALLLGWYGSIVNSRGVDFVMDDATVSKIEKVVKWMYESRRRGLLLCGTLGNGKTTMLKSLNHLFSTTSTYIEAQDVYNYYRQNQELPIIPSGNILLLDDLGVEPSSYNSYGDLRYPLTELLTQRYNSNLTTIIATNYSYEQIGECYGDRLSDRIKEMYAMILYTEPSYRK